MPWNGSGTFAPLPRPDYPPQTGEIIYSDRFINVINDLIGGLNKTLTRDGQSSMSANINANSFKFTGMGAANAAGQPLIYGQSNAALTSATINDFLASPNVPTNPDLSGGASAASQQYVETAVQRAINSGIPDTQAGLSALAILIYIGA